MKKTIRLFSVRAAMMLLTTILFAMTAQTAWATQTTVSLSGNATDGYYINMPEKNTATSFNDAAVLTLDGSIKTFKLYDNGGKSGNYSKDYNGYLVINAPSNYYIHFAGTLDQLGGGATKLTVYDNNTNNTSGYDILYYQPGSQLDVDETSTGSAITVWHKTASLFEAYEDTGFDFTVTLIEKGAYDDLYAEVSSDGKAMTLKCTTTGTATTDASAGRYKYKFIRSNYNWASEFTTASKSAITTVNVDASCANYTGTNLEELFRGFTALTTITGLTNLRTTNVKRMNNMFDHCSKLTMVDLGTWDTRSVAQNRMGSMFNNCSSLTAIIVGPNWQAAEKSRYMFEYCNSLVGGAGTQCPENFYKEYDWTYAHVDGGTANPGFLTADWTGSGTADDPYVIGSKVHLSLLAMRVNGGNTYQNKYFKLGADITYDKNTENNFTPIGTNGKPFMGTFDGNGKTISGLNINLPETDYVGLFGYASSATIKGVKLNNSTIKGKQCVGGIVGSGGNRNTTVQNCAVTSQVTVSGTSSEVGGIVGHYATIRGCTSAAAVSGTQYVGGIIGSGASSTVEHCLYTGSTVTATYSANPFKGAITGDKDNTSMTANYYTADLACKGVNGADEDGARRAYAVTLGDGVSMGETGTAYGTVTNDGDFAITPFANNPGLIYTTKSGGTVTNTTYVGATETVTLSYTGDLADGYAAGYKVNGGEATVGNNTITMPAANATITAETVDVWGVTGGADGTSEAKAYTITTTAGLDLLAQKVNAGTDYYDTYFKLGADITYTHKADGEDGADTENNFTSIGNHSKYFDGHFDGQGYTISGIRIYKGGTTSSTDGYQGLFGQIASYAEVKNITLTDTRITAAAYAGGIVGESSGTIANCHVTNTIKIQAINEYVSDHGGIVGVNSGTVNGCISEATLTNVSGGHYGGIAGYSFGTLEDNFVISATIPETAFNKHGAIVGYFPNGTLKNNYYTACTVAGTANATNVGVGQSVGDMAGARRAVAIGTAEGVTITPTGEATTYNVSGITAYADNTVIGYDSKLYAGASDAVKLNISYAVEGYVATGYTDGNGHALTANNDGTYTLTMTATAPTITAIVDDVWGMAKGADGTSEAKAYTITTTAGLDLLAKKVNAGTYYYDTYFKLGADITYTHKADGEEGADTENNFTSIGNYSKWFDGHFDGQGYTISGIRIYKGGTDYSTDGFQGLFGNILIHAEVKNITLADTRITAASETGGIAGASSGTIANCHVTNTVKIRGIYENANRLGGIVGENGGGTVSGCISEARLTNVSGSWWYGGIAGYIGTESTLENNFVIGATIPATTNNSYGAIVGQNNNGTLTDNYYTNCTVAGTANATNVGVGVDSHLQPVGDVVENDGALYDVWDVTKGADGSEAKPYTITTTAGLDLLAQKVDAGTNYSGKYFKLDADITYTHLADDADGADTENNFTPIGRSGSSFHGHFDGNGKTISGIRFYSDYTDDKGLFGCIGSSAEVKNVTLADTRISAIAYTGGIVGENSDGKITNCHVTNTVEIIGSSSAYGNCYGGIVGYNSTEGTVSGCISEATLTNVSGGSCYGGIAGENTGTLTNNFVIGATIPATSNNSHGAIVGENYEGTLKNNYYTACTVAGVKNATNVGVGIDQDINIVGDVAESNGALIVHQITLAEGVTDVTIDAGAKVYTFDSKNYYVAGTTVKLTYTGTPATGYVFNGITVGEGVTVTPSGNDYTITMPAKDVTVSTSFKKLLTNTDITVATIADQTCTGSEIEPAITVKDGETDITGECTITYSDNTAVGTATVTITAKATSAAYAGETTLNFDIQREMSGLFADGNQWTSYVAQEDLALPDGLTAYTVTALGETTATAAALGYIPQGEPVLLCRSDKTSNLYRARAGSGTAPATNLLQAASSTNQPRAYQDYVLYQDAFILTSGGTLATGKVFLPMPSANASRAVARSIVLDDGETTGMEDVRWQMEEGSGGWYSIDGRKLDGKPTRKGVYIQNGKKVVVK